MAGIAGYFGNDQTALSDLSNGLGSRGPDTSEWRSGKLGLAIRAALPTIHTSGGLAVVVDGIAETTRLLTGYAEHGAEALVQPGEPYAIAVADPEREALLLARSGDGPGLYYAEVAGNVYAAAEPAALFAAGAPAAPDREVVRRFVETGACDDSERTFFSRVRRVLPGQVVEITPSGVRTALVELGRPQPAPSPPLAVQEAVRHGRVGVRLNGGPDDSALLAAVLANPGACRPVPVYATTPGHPVQEATASVRREMLPLGPAELLADLPHFLADVGEPVPDLASYLTWSAARASTGDADVLLDPTAGDEGYLPRIADRIAARFGVAVRFPLAGQPMRPPSEAAPDEQLEPLLHQIKDRVYGAFLTDAFASRPWVDTGAALARFDQFVAGHGRGRGVASGREARQRRGRGRYDAGWFWRLFLVEQWLRRVEAPRAATPAPAAPFTAHPGKQLEIKVSGKGWVRFPVRTHRFVPGDDVCTTVARHVTELVAEARADARYRQVFAKPWYVMLAEKVVAVSQGRSHLLWEIQPGWRARLLARMTTRQPYGPGHRSAWTMELAIREAGCWRMLLAVLISLLGRPFGKSHWFDTVAGQRVAAIDGPTEHSMYPANLAATLGAEAPEAVADQMVEALRRALPEDAAEHLGGCVVMDARDTHQRVRGLRADRNAEFFAEAFADNPLGQGGEQTPIAVLVSASAVRRPKRSKARVKSNREPARSG